MPIWFLVNKIIDELKNAIEKPTEEKPETENSETLSLVVDYLGLTNVFSKKLGRVISRHN